jgi:hypothetical protein
MKIHRFDGRLSILPVFASMCSTAWAAPIYWDPLVGGNGHWYEPVRVEAGISWNDAKSAAEARGGYLVTITSGAENAFVLDLIQSPTLWLPSFDTLANKVYYNGPLIGGYQEPGSVEPDGGWTWVNGEGAVASGYSNWLPSQPDNNGGLQQVLRFYNQSDGNVPPPASGLWDDASGFDDSWHPSFVMEWSSTPQDVPEPSTYAAGVAIVLLVGFQRWRRAATTGR